MNAMHQMQDISKLQIDFLLEQQEGLASENQINLHCNPTPSCDHVDEQLLSTTAFSHSICQPQQQQKHYSNQELSTMSLTQLRAILTNHLHRYIQNDLRSNHSDENPQNVGLNCDLPISSECFTSIGCIFGTPDEMLPYEQQLVSLQNDEQQSHQKYNVICQQEHLIGIQCHEMAALFERKLHALRCSCNSLQRKLLLEDGKTIMGDDK